MTMLIIQITMFIEPSSWQSHCESSLGSCDEYSMAPVGCRPLDQVNWFEPQNRLHPSPFIFSTQPKSWHSFCHRMDGRRLSQPLWLLHTEMVYPPVDGHRGLSSHPVGVEFSPLKQIYSPWRRTTISIPLSSIMAMFSFTKVKTGEPSTSCQNAPDCVSNFKIFPGVFWTPHPWGGGHPSQTPPPLGASRLDLWPSATLSSPVTVSYSPWNKWLDKALFLRWDCIREAV